MKKTLMAILLCCTGTLAHAELVSDTLDVDREVTSVKDINKVSLDKKGKDSKVNMSFHLALGFSTMVGVPADYTVKVGPALENSWSLNVDWRPFGKKNEWSLGFAIGWRHYRFGNATYLSKDAQGIVGQTPYPDGLTDRRSSMRIFSLQVPIMYTHNFDQKGRWSVSLGAIVNFNTGARSTRSYTLNEEDYSINTYKIEQRPVTIDAMLVVETPYFLPLYCKYSPMSVFKKDRGPKMHQLSFGIFI